MPVAGVMPSEGKKMLNWFALLPSGELRNIGPCTDFDEACTKAETAIWIIDPKTAASWAKEIQAEA